MLWLYRRVVFGRAEKPEVLEMVGLDRRETMIFVPLTILVLWFGVYPSTLLDVMAFTVSDIMAQLATELSSQTAMR